MKLKDDFYDRMSMKWLWPDHDRTPFTDYPEGSNQKEMADMEKEYLASGVVYPKPPPTPWDLMKDKDSGYDLKKPTDAINPSHYKGIIGEYQYIECMEFVLGKEGLRAHLLGQGYKYLMRMGKKDAEQQELNKAIWYFGCLRILLRDGTIIGRLKELE